jgi:hypothetical protein
MMLVATCTHPVVGCKRAISMNSVLWNLWNKRIEQDYDAFDEFPLRPGAADSQQALMRRLERQYIRNVILQDGLVQYF